jgi:hypothetical protein
MTIDDMTDAPTIEDITIISGCALPLT